MRIKETDLEQKLVNVYKKYGVNMFLDVCAKMLDIKDRKDHEKKKQTNGEVCEIVLDVLTQRYIEKKRLRAHTFHSMILKDKNNSKSDFRTELDFTLISPRFCVTGECKSFVGDIVVTSECTLERTSFSADVARQSRLHLNTLIPYLEEYTLSDAQVTKVPAQMFCFVYSNGTIRDTRDQACKRTVPILTISNLYGYYDSLYNRYSRDVYDIDRANKMFCAMSNSSILRREHQEFVGY